MKTIILIIPIILIGCCGTEDRSKLAETSLMAQVITEDLEANIIKEHSNYNKLMEFTLKSSEYTEEQKVEMRKQAATFQTSVRQEISALKKFVDFVTKYGQGGTTDGK